MAVAPAKSLRSRLAARRRKIGKWLRSPAFKRLTHRTVPIVTIFGVCAFVSYGHGVTFALMGGESEQNARLMPILYDAMMFASILFMAPSVRHPVARVAAYLGFGFGFIMSLVANIVASAPTVIGKVVGVSVALCLVLTAAMVHFGSKPAPRRKVARKPAAKAVQLDTRAVPALGARNTSPGLVATAEPVW